MGYGGGFEQCILTITWIISASTFWQSWWFEKLLTLLALPSFHQKEKDNHKYMLLFSILFGHAAKMESFLLISHFIPSHYSILSSEAIASLPPSKRLSSPAKQNKHAWLHGNLKDHPLSWQSNWIFSSCLEIAIKMTKSTNASISLELKVVIAKHHGLI